MLNLWIGLTRNFADDPELPDETKQKISASLRGRQKSDVHKQNIAKGLSDYWKSVPSKGDDTDFTSSGRIV